MLLLGYLNTLLYSYYSYSYKEITTVDYNYIGYYTY